MQRETGKDGEPSDHNASLILSEREKEERLSGNVQDPCAVQESLSVATRAKARFYVRLVTCLPDTPRCAQSLTGNSLWEDDLYPNVMMDFRACARAGQQPLNEG